MFVVFWGREPLKLKMQQEVSLVHQGNHVLGKHWGGWGVGGGGVRFKKV